MSGAQRFAVQPQPSASGAEAPVDWVIALNDAGYITIDNEGFIHAIEKLHRIFDEGNSNVENWDKIERSAIKSGSKFHEFVQKQGYYTVN